MDTLPHTVNRKPYTDASASAKNRASPVYGDSDCFGSQC